MRPEVPVSALPLVAVGCAIFAALPAIAQQSGSHLSAERHDIGRVETRIENYDQALGVVTRLNRPLGIETECEGVCFFPSSSQPLSWRCAPTERCDLDCNVNPPVGGLPLIALTELT
jgi:hypothetical protein